MHRGFFYLVLLSSLIISNILDHHLCKIHEIRIHRKCFVKIRTLTYLAPFCLHRFSRCPRLFFSSINRRCVGAPFSRFLFLSSFFLDLSPAWFNISFFFLHFFRIRENRIFESILLSRFEHVSSSL